MYLKVALKRRSQRHPYGGVSHILAYGHDGKAERGFTKDIDRLVYTVDIEGLVYTVDFKRLIYKVVFKGLVYTIDYKGLVYTVDFKRLIYKVVFKGLVYTIDYKGLVYTVVFKGLICTRLYSNGAGIRYESNSFLSRFSCDSDPHALA